MVSRHVQCIADLYQCTVKGWLYMDDFVFWKDEADPVCKHFKITTPTDTTASWTRSAFWGGVARFAHDVFADGFQPQDLMSLAAGYWVKEYHDEMQEDLRLIKSSMNMLGAPVSTVADKGEEDNDVAAQHIISECAERGVSPSEVAMVAQGYGREMQKRARDR